MPPPAATPPLFNALAVDEFEFILTAVASSWWRPAPCGSTIYNRGEDDHNLVVIAANGTEYRTDIAPLASSRLEPVLRPGRYEVFCDLFAGTPESHYERGMVFELEVR